MDGLYVSWIRLNNPKQYNSYTTEMAKGIISGFENASLDRSVVAVVFTGTSLFAFCMRGNSKEYSEFYSRRQDEYGQNIAECRSWDMDMFAEVMGKPRKQSLY